MRHTEIIQQINVHEMSTKEAVSQKPDSLLLARVAQQDRAALSEIHARFERPLFNYLYHLLGNKELAEDVLQEVLIVVWQKAHTFKGNSPVTNWLFGIAHHQAFKMLRRDSHMKFIELEAAYDLSDHTVDLEASVLGRATHEEVAAAMAILTPEHREVLELAFFQNFSCKEMADIVGIPIGTVKSRLSYARHALKKALLNNGWEA